jgi:hypothetical protein
MHRWLFAGLAVLGFACILLSSQVAWMSVPLADHRHAISAKDIVAAEPECTQAFKIIMVAGLMLMIATAIPKLHWGIASSLVASTMLVTAISFPYAITLYSPRLSADAAWLQMQHDNLIWLGGDINLSAESGHAFWGNKIYSNDIPRQIKVATIPTQPTWFPRLDQASDLILWLGYGEAFCQFSRRGWTLAVLGWSMFLLVSIQIQGDVILRRIGVSLVCVSVLAFLVIAAAWGRTMSAASKVQEAAILTSHRQYSDALEQLELACQRLPTLSQDTYYIAQRGLLESRLGKATHYTALFEAVGTERRGQYDVAFESFQQLAEVDDPAIVRESLRAILRYAIQDFNSGRTELATHRFKFVLERQPCNFKAIYLLQICYLCQNQVSEVESMSQWMDKATDHLSFHSKRIFRATTERYAAIAASQGSDPVRTWIHHRKAKNP